MTCLHENIPVAVLIETVSIQNLEFWYIATAMNVFPHEFFIRERLLRVFVKELHVRVGGRGIKVVVELFHVLSVITLMSSDTEQTLLQDDVFLIP